MASERQVTVIIPARNEAQAVGEVVRHVAKTMKAATPPLGVHDLGGGRRLL